MCNPPRFRARGRVSALLVLALLTTSTFAACDLLDELSTPEEDVFDPDATGDVQEEPDTTTPDADVSPDTEDDATDPDTIEPEDPCLIAAPGPADGPRVVLLSMAYTASGDPGEEIMSLTLTNNGDLSASGMRLNLGARISRVLFQPGGRLAFALSEEGTLTSIRVGGVQDLEILDQVVLPPAGHDYLELSPDPARIHAIGFNSTATGGISTIEVDCDGMLTLREDVFYPLVLASTMAWIDERRAVVLGGQRFFDDVIDEDVRLLEWDSETGFSELFAGDFFAINVRARRIAVSPNGTEVIVPNNGGFSEEGGTAIVLEVAGDTLVERQRIGGLDDVEEAWLSPEGDTLLFTQVEPGRVAAYRRNGTTWTSGTSLSSMGLPEQLALVSRGALRGSFLLPSVAVSGSSFVSRFRAVAPGELSVSSTLQLGEGLDRIPNAIAIQP